MLLGRRLRLDGGLEGEEDGGSEILLDGGAPYLGTFCPGLTGAPTPEDYTQSPTMSPYTEYVDVEGIHIDRICF